MATVSGVLAPYVDSLMAYDADLGLPGVHRGLPSTSLTLVLAVDEPLDVGWAGAPDSRSLRWSTVSGLHSHPAEIHHAGSQRGVQVGLTVAGARAFFGMPAADLARELVELGDLDDVAPALTQLPEQLAEAPWERAAVVVQRALVGALAATGAAGPRAAVGQALAGLTRGGSVAAVADDLGYSRRHLGSLVRAECGLAPKEYQRVARFAASRRVIGRRTLGEVAHVCGYVDQAHLTNEWRAMAGCTPGTWLREEFPFLQDTPTDVDEG